MIDTLKEPKPAAVPARDQLHQALAAFAKAEPDVHPDWWRTTRDAARRQAAQLAFPTTNDEEWKYTNMAPVLQLPVHPARRLQSPLIAEDIASFNFGLDCYRIVFIDGFFREDLSQLPAKGGPLVAGNFINQFRVGSRDLERHLGRHAHAGANFFTALNAGYFHDGAYIAIAAGEEAVKPVQVLFIGASGDAGATSLPRTLVVAPRGSSVKVIESHVSLADAPRLTSAVTELVLGADAHVEHCKLQQESNSAFHVATIQAVQERGSKWTSHSIATGSRIARNQVQALFQDEGAEAIMNGLYLGRDEQLIDHHTVVDHAKPHCESHEFYHGILADKAHGVFNGKIFVRKDAQKTNAKQTNRNLLLSDSASVDTKPQLEIFADDVKCTHGATIGQLSEEALFYLRARGIGKELARRMLIQAFASDVVERISIEPVRASLERMLLERFQAVTL